MGFSAWNPGQKQKTNITIRLAEIWLKSSIKLTKNSFQFIYALNLFFLHIFNIKNDRVKRKVCIGSKNKVHAPV